MQNLIFAQDTINNGLNVPMTTGSSEEDGMFASWDNASIDPYKFIITTDFVGENINIIDTKKGESFTMPHDGIVTSHFGWRWHRAHKGTDIDCETGDIIKAAFGGVVRIARYHSGYGNLVILRHNNGLETFYGHLSAFLVSEGDWVSSGQEIALGGNTGRSTGSHLHFEVRYKGNAFDARKIINFENRELHQNSVYLDKTFFKPVSVPSPVTNNSGETEYHVIERGETVTQIAKKYAVTVSQIYNLNRITSKTKLEVGRRLRVK